MRYDEVGQFFVREMKLKRKYVEILSPKIMVLRLRLKKITGLNETWSLLLVGTIMYQDMDKVMEAYTCWCSY